MFGEDSPQLLECKKGSIMGIKETLFEMIQRTYHHSFLFVGSGFSKRYMNIEKWDELLRNAENLYSDFLEHNNKLYTLADLIKAL